MSYTDDLFKVVGISTNPYPSVWDKSVCSKSSYEESCKTTQKVNYQKAKDHKEETSHSFFFPEDIMEKVELLKYGDFVTPEEYYDDKRRNKKED